MPSLPPESPAPAGYPLSRGSSVVVLVDLQESLLSAIPDRQALLSRCSLLAKTAERLSIPILVTTQNVSRLGMTVPELTAAFEAGTPVFDKMTFSAARCPAFMEYLRETARKQVVVCGVETHICVSQSAIDLKEMGFAVTVVADACSARSVERHKLGMERIRDLGVLPAATEAVVYEWLEEAGTPEFRDILKLIKAQ